MEVIEEPKAVSYTRDKDGVVTDRHLNDVYNTIHTGTVGIGFNKGGVKKYTPTITSNSFEHNNLCIVPLLIPEATAKGYAEAYEGDSINLALPNSTTRRGRVGHQQANTLDTSCNQGVVANYRIRKLTPRECFRLMDVSEPDIDKLLNAGISNSQLYKLAGNSIVVSCLYHIFRKMFIEKENENQQLTLF